MRSAEVLWAEFLLFCGEAQPDDQLALDYIQETYRLVLCQRWARLQAAHELRTLQRLLAWREKYFRENPAGIVAAALARCAK